MSPEASIAILTEDRRPDLRTTQLELRLGKIAEVAR